MNRARILVLLLSGAFCLAQAPPAATMKQLMLDLVLPASNDLLLSIYRGEPKDEMEWAAIRRSALALSESANLLTLPGRARDNGDWAKDARMLAEAGTAAYKAAQAKDQTGLAAVAGSLDASCTSCHKKYRPDVFPTARGER